MKFSEEAIERGWIIEDWGNLSNSISSFIAGIQVVALEIKQWV